MFTVQGSVHRKYIPFDIQGGSNMTGADFCVKPHMSRSYLNHFVYPSRCNITLFIYFRKTALHVSGGISTHHQEHTQLYLQHLVLIKPLLLPAAVYQKEYSRNVLFSILYFTHNFRRLSKLLTYILHEAESSLRN